MDIIVLLVLVPVTLSAMWFGYWDIVVIYCVTFGMIDVLICGIYRRVYADLLTLRRKVKGLRSK